jgi:AcrR family transcriptional regulator
VARTRAALQRAHLALIIENGHAAVTVEEICAAANVGRSTFYAHYADKEALHREGIDSLRRELIAHQAAAARSSHGASEDWLAFSLPMFEHARGHLDLYRALARGAGGDAIGDIRTMLCDVVRAALKPDRFAANDAPAREFAVRYLVGAYMAVLIWWLDGGARTSPQEMDALFQRLAVDGLQSIRVGRSSGPDDRSGAVS